MSHQIRIQVCDQVQHVNARKELGAAGHGGQKLILAIGVTAGAQGRRNALEYLMRDSSP